MPVPHGGYYRIKTYASGKRVQLYIYNGRIVESKVLPGRKLTRSRKSLRRARRRIRL